jgi:hypothetical protein
MNVAVASLAQWPVGTRVELLDAWFRNPIEVKVTKHPNAEHIISEDDRGVVYYAHYKRITRIVKKATPDRLSFEDLLDDPAPKADEFDDLI